ncbi:MAG TPA: hypothetical protein PK205_14685 [Promineifilum sp.]|nr:hypothetical protein [Promineifilum sp.]
MKNNRNYIFAGVLVLLLLLPACGGQAQIVQTAPLEGWPEVTTRLAAESTAVALTPTAVIAGRIDVPLTVSDPQDALRQVKDTMAKYATYERVTIVAVSGKLIVLTATYEAGRTRGIVWDGPWQPTVYTMQGTSTTWAGDDRFWGDTP